MSSQVAEHRWDMGQTQGSWPLHVEHCLGLRRKDPAIGLLPAESIEVEQRRGHWVTSRKGCALVQSVPGDKQAVS